MRTFETDSIQDESVARLLRGLDPWSLEFAQSEEKYEQLQRFIDEAEGEGIRYAEYEGEQIPYERPCFSVLSMGGQLIAARHRKTMAGVPTPPQAHYAVMTGLLDDSELSPWRVAPWRRVGRDKDLELTIEVPDQVPALSLVETIESPHERALIEAKCQMDADELGERSTRVLLATSAWQLLKPGYVHEPLQSTYNLLQTTAYARLRGFTPLDKGINQPQIADDVIDIYR